MSEIIGETWPQFEFVIVQRKSEHIWTMSCGNQTTEMHNHTTATLLEKMGNAGFMIAAGGGGMGPSWFVFCRHRPTPTRPDIRAQFMGVPDEEQPDLGLQERLKKQVTISDLFEAGWVDPGT